jgi:hypothetical protein
MQVYKERNITARPQNSFEDQQMCDLLMQIMDDQDFFQITSSKPFTRWTFLIMNMKVLNTLISHLTAKMMYQSVSHQAMTSIIAFKLPPKSKEDV